MLQFPHLGEIFFMFLGPALEPAGDTRHAQVIQVMYPNSKEPSVLPVNIQYGRDRSFSY